MWSVELRYKSLRICFYRMDRCHCQIIQRNPKGFILNSALHSSHSTPELRYLFTRAPAPPMMASTSPTVAMLVSPGVVMASAPWAAP